VERGQAIAILESMKVEISVEAPVAGVVRRLRVAKGGNVGADKEICLVVSSEEQAMKDLSLVQLRSMYKLGILDPQLVVQSILIKVAGTDIFCATVDAGSCSSRLVALAERRKTEYLPLYGILFAVGASVDVARLPTTSGCDAGAYVPEKSASVVTALEEAGAILVGKSNMDQYGVGATGTLVSRDGALLTNPLESSSVVGGGGSAVAAVAANLVTFSVHVDCANSAVASPLLVGGDGVIGAKVTEGLLSMAGVEPSCPSFGSLFVCATGTGDIESVLAVCIAGRGARDRSLRRIPVRDSPPLRSFAARVLSSSPHLVFPGDDDGVAAETYHRAVQKLCQLGGRAKDIDISPFAEVVSLFETVPLDTARCGALSTKIKDCGDAVLPSVSSAILRSEDMSAAKMGCGLEALRHCKRTVEHSVWPVVDVLAVPTVASTPTVDTATEDPVGATEALTKFTRFIAPMDLCSITLGCITLMAPPFREHVLLAIAANWQA
jgi:allophanate hydrolase